MPALPTWRDLLARATRNAIQALLPTLVLIAGTGRVTGLSGWAVADLAGCAALVSALKALAVPPVDPAASGTALALDRAFPAAAATALGFMTAAGFSLLTADWQTMLIASAGAFVTALAQTWLDPAAPKALPLYTDGDLA